MEMTIRNLAALPARLPAFKVRALIAFWRRDDPSCAPLVLEQQCVVSTTPNRLDMERLARQVAYDRLERFGVDIAALEDDFILTEFFAAQLADEAPPPEAEIIWRQASELLSTRDAAVRDGYYLPFDMTEQMEVYGDPFQSSSARPMLH